MRALHAEGVPVAPTAATGAERHLVPDAWLAPAWGSGPNLAEQARAEFRARLAGLRELRAQALAQREWGRARRLQAAEVQLRRNWRPAPA